MGNTQLHIQKRNGNFLCPLSEWHFCQVPRHSVGDATGHRSVPCCWGEYKAAPAPGEAVCICPSRSPAAPAAPLRSRPGAPAMLCIKGQPVSHMFGNNPPRARYRNPALGAWRNITQLLTAGRRFQADSRKSARWQTLRGKSKVQKCVFRVGLACRDRVWA